MKKASEREMPVTPVSEEDEIARKDEQAAEEIEDPRFSYETLTSIFRESKQTKEDSSLAKSIEVDDTAEELD